MWSLSIPPGTSPNLSGMGLAKFGGLLGIIAFWIFGEFLWPLPGEFKHQNCTSQLVQECHARSIPIGIGKLTFPTIYIKLQPRHWAKFVDWFCSKHWSPFTPSKKWENNVYINHVNSSPFIPMIGTTKGLLVLPLLFWEPLNSLHGCTYRPFFHMGQVPSYKPSKSNKSKNDSSESTHITWNQWNW